MAYTPPNGAIVALEIAPGYTPPLGSAITFAALTSAFYLSINASTEDAVACFSLHHTPNFYLTIAATTEDAVADFTLEHFPLYYLTIAATTDDAVADFTLNFAPRVSITIAATTADAVLSCALFHDWVPGINPYRDAKIFQIRLEKTGLPPLILPATNVSVRSSIEGRQSSITATIPDFEQVDAIAERSSGGVLVFAGGYATAGTRRFNTILSLPFTDVRPDEGTTNKSLTLTAKGPSPATSAKSVSVSAIEYQSVNGLKRLIRSAVNVNLLPGDSVVTSTATWTAGEIVYALGEGGESMTVTEA